MSGAKTYQSQLIHITTWLRTHSRFITGKELAKAKTKTKEDILFSLTEFFVVMLNFLENADEEALSETVDMWYSKVSKEAILWFWLTDKIFCVFKSLD